MRSLVALLIFVTAGNCWSADYSATEAEIVGTWRVDTNLLNGQTLPTNFLAFALTLKADGAFLATNIPADFFFSYEPQPATPEARGTWTLKPHEIDGTDQLLLDFRKPSELLWRSKVQFKFAGMPYFSRVARRYIYMCYHVGKPDVLVFYLIKEE